MLRRMPGNSDENRHAGPHTRAYAEAVADGVKISDFKTITITANDSVCYFHVSFFGPLLPSIWPRFPPLPQKDSVKLPGKKTVFELNLRAARVGSLLGRKMHQEKHGECSTAVRWAGGFRFQNMCSILAWILQWISLTLPQRTLLDTCWRNTPNSWLVGCRILERGLPTSKPFGLHFVWLNPTTWCFESIQIV